MSHAKAKRGCAGREHSLICSKSTALRKLHFTYVSPKLLPANLSEPEAARQPSALSGPGTAGALLTDGTGPAPESALNAGEAAGSVFGPAASVLSVVGAPAGALWRVSAVALLAAAAAAFALPGLGAVEGAAAIAMFGVAAIANVLSAVAAIELLWVGAVAAMIGPEAPALQEKLSRV